MTTRHDEHDPAERTVRLLGRWGRELDPAPEPPREAMWEAVRDQAVPSGHAPSARPGRARRAWVPAVGMAAALVLGLWLGRVTGPTVPASAPAGASPGAPLGSPLGVPAGAAPGTTAPGGDAYSPTLAASARELDAPAVRHLAATGRLLSRLEGEGASAFVQGMRGWAEGLLAETRFLLDSPLTADPELRGLLEDLEMVLVEVTLLPPEGEERSRVELDLIADGMASRAILARIRTLVPDTLMASGV